MKLTLRWAAAGGPTAQPVFTGFATFSSINDDWIPPDFESKFVREFDLVYDGTSWDVRLVFDSKQV